MLCKKKMFSFVADFDQHNQREYDWEEEEDKDRETSSPSQFRMQANWQMKGEHHTAVFGQTYLGNFSIAFQFVLGFWIN